MTVRLSIRAHEVASLLDQAPSGVDVLSLDCFDTLLWRNVHAPRDVFAGIDLPGGGVEPRMWAEGAARRAMLMRRKTNEVALTDVYRRLLPNADAAAVQDAIDHEVALEARHLFAFAPTVDLMRAARARGMRVVIVSDFYLPETSLRDLIARVAGDEVLAVIDHVFVSCDHGTGKGGTLFDTVLRTLKTHPAQVLHVGDNRKADQDSPFRQGIHSAHLVQFDTAAETRLRLEGVAGVLIDPTARVTTPVYQPHRAQVALRTSDDTATALGHDVLGPIMLGFARWIGREVAAMSARLGKPVRPLFLMRDGHLPLEVYRAAFGETGAVGVEISRFAAAAAHFTDRDALADFVTDALDRAPPEIVATQLHLRPNEAARLGKLTASAFRRDVLQPQYATKILARSKAFADRMIAHLAQAGVRAGDAVMFVDLGYNGSVQNLVERMLRERMKLDVAGRYLLLREEQRTGLDKAGLLDVRHYETRTLHALCTVIAVLEQLSTVAQGSTIDYSDAGDPVRKAAGIKGAQSAIRDTVQAAAVAFARDGSDGAGKGAYRPAASNGPDADRVAAAAVLARLLFLPTADEVTLLEAFDHDVNLGTQQVVKLLDADDAAGGLRRRGVAYINETGRMFVPGELQRHGLALNLSLFGSTRFALDLRNGDFEVGGIEIPAILIGERDQAVIPVDAHPTADGYYRVIVPVAAGGGTVAVQLGQPFEWVQVDDARWTPIDLFDRHGPDRGIPAATVADGMEAVAEGLYRCTPTGFLFAPAPPCDTPQVLSVVFRPIRWRDAAVKAKVAA